MSSAEHSKLELRKNPRAWLVAAAALAVVVAAGLLVVRGAASGSTGGEPTSLEQALDAVLVARGMDRAGFVARSPAGGGAPELHVEIPPQASYAGVNADITRAVEAAGGLVLDAIERRPSPERPAGLELYVGTRDEVTHRVLLERERPFGNVDADEPTRIALVFDDLGYSTEGLAAQLLALDVPLTFAVLPGLAKSDEFADAARAHGHEVLLHLPMEPLDAGRHDPGRSALFASLAPEENTRRLRVQLAGLRSYDGVSNHMGSRATASAEVVDLVLAEMKRRDASLFFLDSRTTPFSVVPERARRAGVPFFCNNLFLDGGDEENALPAVQTERLESIARRRGHAIGIGHVRPATVAAVRAAVERWQAEGIRLVRLSDLRQR